MTYAVMRLAAFATFIAFLGILIWYVPRLDLGAVVLAAGAWWWLARVMPRVKEGVFDRTSALVLSSEEVFDFWWSRGVLSLYAKLPGGEEHYRVAVTDASGSFTLPDAPTGRFLLKAYAPSTIYVSRIVALEDGDTATIRFGLPDRVVENPAISQAKVRSTCQRSRYAAADAVTGRPRLGRQVEGRRLGGMQILMPRRRSARRKGPLS